MFKELEKVDVKEVPRWVGTYVRTTLKEILDGTAYRGRRGRRGARGDGGEEGPPGKDGANGKRGVTGAPGPHGVTGADGIQGKRGIQGVTGLTGRAGELGPPGAKGDKGDKGDQGQVGPVPRHKWEGTRLSFEQPGGKFGQSINLQGPGGGRGASGGRSANPGYSSIALVGTDLVFSRDTAGPLGPDITVDLSGLNTGGGFAGLGPWRYRTETSAPPSSGQIRFDNSDPELATELYLHETNSNSEDLANFLALLEAGDLLYIQDQSDADNFILVEVSTNTDDGTYVTIGIANAAQQGAAISQNTTVNIVMSVAGGGVGSVVTGLTTAADGDDITLTQTAGGNQVADTSEFLWKPGKAGGQSAIGGTAVSEELLLRGTTDANLGQVRFESPIDIEDVSPANALNPYALRYAPSQTFPAAFIGGGISISPTISFANALFIWEALRATPIITSDVAPGFAAFTLFNALPVLASGSAASENPLQSLCLNAGVVIEHDNTGTRSTVNNIAVSAALQTRCGLSGAVLNMTQVSAVQFSPTFSTVSGATVNMGTLTGLKCNNPAAALFQPSAGVENMTAYYGVDVAAIPFGGNVSKAALRSAIASATNARFLSNIGTAESDFGAGDIHVNDNTWFKYGNTLAAPDIATAWASAEGAYSWTTFWGVGGNPLYLEGTAADEWIFRHHSNDALDIGIGFDVNAVVFGTTLPTPNSNNWFVQFAAPNQRQVQIGGEYSDVLWTAGGSIDVNGLAVSDLQAFKINSPAVILNGGTISDISNLFVQAMPSFGATRTQALRVLGRGRIDGHINQGSQAPAQITGNVNDWQLGANNNQRGVVLLDSDGAYNITGIDASFGFAQTGDILNIINTSAFTITFTHQDVLSTAAYRIITATGAGIAVAAGETIRLWYDDTGTARWRHIRLQ